MAEHDDGTTAAVAHKIGGESPEKKVDHDETAREIIGGEEVLEKTDRDSTVFGKLINKVRGSSSTSSNSEDDRSSATLKSKVFRLFGREKPVHKVLGGGKHLFLKCQQRKPFPDTLSTTYNALLSASTSEPCKLVHSDDDFRRRFQMKHPVFLRLLQSIQQQNPYVVQRRNCANRLGFSAHQKVTVALRMLAYGSSADALDEYLRMGETTALETLLEFCSTVVRMHKDEYLCAPTVADLKRLLQKVARRGFPGMIGSLDRMNWHWKNCPTEWHGVYTGRAHKPTIILEAVASHDTWIWHAFFGMPGARNDIATLGCLHLFDKLTRGEVPNVRNEVNGREHHMPYCLVDGIYPKLATFVHFIKNPRSPQEQHFSKMQESYRKDVERAFCILQARFTIIKQSGRGWDRVELHNIMMTCIILHNIIVEDESDGYIDDDSEDEETDINRSRRARAYNYDGASVDPNSRMGEVDFQEYMMRYDAIQSEPANKQLQQDLIEHQWTRLGRELGPVGVRRQSSKSLAKTSSEIMIQSVQEPMKLVDRLRSLSVKVGSAQYIAGSGVFLSIRGMYQADGSSKIAKESIELQKAVDKRVGKVSQQLTESNELDSCRNYYLCRADYFLSRGWWDSLMGTPYEKKYATEIAATKKERDTAAKNRAQKLAKERQDAQKLQKLLREEEREITNGSE